MSLVGHVTIYKRKNRDRSLTYYLRWRLEGEGYRSRRLFRTEPSPRGFSKHDWMRQAREAAYELEKHFRGEDAGRDPNSPGFVKTSIPYAMTCYLQWIQGDDLHPRQLAESTCQRQERVLESFLKHVGENWPNVRRPNQLCNKQLGNRGGNGHPCGWRIMRQMQFQEQWGREIGDSTLRCELFDIKSFFRFCHAQGWMPLVLPVVMPPKPPPEIVVPGDEEVRRAVHGFEDPAQRLVILTLAATGMRQGELRGLDMHAYDAGAGTLTISRKGRERNKRHQRVIPVGPELRRMLDDWMASDRSGSWSLFSWNGTAIRLGVMNRWLRPFGLKPHGLRRWTINALHKLECPQIWIDALVGHASRNVDATSYVRPSLEDLRGWLAKVEAALACPATPSSA